MKRCPICGSQIQDLNVGCPRCARQLRRPPGPQAPQAPRRVEPESRPTSASQAGEQRRATLIIEPPVRCPSCGASWKGLGPYCSQCRFRIEPSLAGAGAASRADRLEQDELELDQATALAFLARVLLIGGFVATFIPGFAIIGFLAVWVGCGLGLPGSTRMRWLGGFGLSAALLLLSVAVATGVTAFTRSAPPDDLNVGVPFLEITIESWQYAEGELSVAGTVANRGSAATFSPAIELVVYEDDTRDAVVASGTAYPEGTFDAYLRKGQETTFEHAVLVPDQPGQVVWEIVVGDAPGRVIGAPP